MRILFLTQIVPYPPDAGPKVKTWHVLRYLVERGHQVTLATFFREEETPSLEVLRQLCDGLIAIPISRSRLTDFYYWMKSHLSKRPFIVERDDIPAMHTAVQDTVYREHIDVIHADQLTMAQFALPPRDYSRAGNRWPSTIFDAHNAVWTIINGFVDNAHPILKPVFNMETNRVRSYENWLIQEFDHTLAVSELDADALIPASAGSSVYSDIRSKITVIPIAVDTKNLQPVMREPQSLNIVTLGTLHYPPNADGVRWFANDVFPLVRQKIPEATLTIIGKNPPSDLVHLANKQPDIIYVTGYVPDLIPYLKKASIMVVPVRAGGGMRVRILDAFARGIPVVTTTVGLEGIKAQPGTDVIVEDEAQAMSDEICRLIKDEDLQCQLSQNGRQLVESSYDWQVVLKKLDSVYHKIHQTRSAVYGQNKNKYLIIIISVSVLLRLIAAFYLGNRVEILPGTYDQVSYHRLALRVINGYGFSFGEKWWPLTAANAPTAHWSYLYTLYLAIVYRIFGPNPLVARGIQAVITGILHPYLIYKIGNYTFNNLVGILSAGLSSIYAYFIYYAASLMTGSFYITAILASIYVAMLLSGLNQVAVPKRQETIKLAVLLGILLSIGALLRQLIILFFPFLFIWIWYRWKKESRNLITFSLMITSIVIGLIILPITFFNYSRFDRFVLLNTNAGFAFFWGNHPIYGTHFEPILPPEMGSYQDLIPVELRHLDEAALDQELLKRGLQFIIDDPVRYIKLSFSRIPAYFMFWPSKESGLISNISRAASFGIAWPFMLFGLLRSPFHRSARYKFTKDSPLILILLFVIIYTMIHLLTWSLIRYRLPVDAVLLIFVSLTLVDIMKYLQKKFDQVPVRSGNKI